MGAEFVRIGGNYLRLVLGFAIGVLIVRQLLLYGEDIFNIFTIVTVGAGVGIMLRELLRIALTSHLSKAWEIRSEPGGDEAFRAVFGRAMTLSALAGVVGVGLMGILAMAIPSLSVAPENVDAARAFTAARAAILICAVAISPLLTMLLVLQKFGQMNLLLTCERGADFLGVMAPVVVLTSGAGGSEALTVFAVASAVLVCSLFLFAGWRISRYDRELLRPTWHWGKWAALKPIVISIGWALGLVLSFNLYLRFDTFFVNAELGAAATIAFGLTVQLVGMVRQLTVGVVNGLDAVVAKLTFARNRDDIEAEASNRIVSLNSYLQTVLTLGAILFLGLTARDLLQLWVGDRVSDPAILDQAATISTIMLAGIGARSLSEGWMASLNGIGRIGSYVRWTLLITILNPLGLLMLGHLASGPVTLEHVAIAFATLLAFAHLVVVPAVYVRETGQSGVAIFAPLLRGMVALPLALGAALIAGHLASELPGVLRLGLVALALGTVLGADVVLFAVRGLRHKSAKA